MLSDPSLSCSFTHDHLRSTLTFARDAGYQFISFPEAVGRAATNQSILLRHDVDHSTEAAVSVAEIEAELGIRATYFILLSAEYNSLGPAFTDLQHIAALGHWIGVHYDPMFYRARGLPFPATVHDDARVLGDRLRVDVRAAARHNPVVAPAPNEEISPLIDTYDEAIRHEFRYLSDSCQFWREGCFCHAVTKQHRASLHVLIHAEWWTEDGAGADVILKRIRDERIAAARRVEEETRRLFASLEHLPDRQLFNDKGTR